MTSEQKDFDIVFKKYGGLYQGGTNQFWNLATDAFKVCDEHFKKKYPKLSQIYCDFIDSDSLNAHVTKYNDRYYIGINAGAFIMYFDMFNKMFASKLVYPLVGDVSQETAEEKKLAIAFSNGTPHLLRPETFFMPVDKTRQQYPQWFTFYSILFLACHEYCHIIRGHIDYSISLGDLIYSEIQYSGMKKSKLSFLDSQTLEMDADSLAVNTSLILAERMIRNSEKNEFNKDWSTYIKDWSFAIYSSFRLFGFQNFNLETAQKRTHPITSSRLNMITANLATIFINNPNAFKPEGSKKLIHASNQGIIEAEKAFKLVSYDENKIVEYLKQYNDPYVIKYQEEIRMNWNNLKPKLEKYAFGVLPPLAK